MRFRVVGSDRQTGGRRVLEVEAPSKGAAEKAALERGLEVTHVGPCNDDPRPAPARPRTHSWGLMVLVLLLLLLVATTWFFRDLMLP